MKLEIRILLTGLVLCGILMAGCQESTTTTADAFANGRLTPYYTATATVTITPTAENQPTTTPQPTITSTPQIITLKGNETLWTIAAEHGLTVKQLEDANPGINAYSLVAGMKIVIPAASASSNQQVAPTPSPVGLEMQLPQCTPSLTGGLYCFSNVTNAQAYMVQGVYAQFVLSGNASDQMQVQPALLPLNHLPAGSSLPLFAYFPPPLLDGYRVQVQLLSALPEDTQNSTYLPLTIGDPQDVISTDGYSASTSATVTAAAGAKNFWVAAVAYDAAGNVVAVRQLDQKGSFDNSNSSTFMLYVYSIAGKIDHIALFGEASK